MATDVFVLFHQFEFRDIATEDLEDRAKLIGVYSSEQEAKLAIDRVKDQPGFKDYPEGFVTDCYELNLDHWTEGFITLPNVS